MENESKRILLQPLQQRSRKGWKDAGKTSLEKTFKKAEVKFGNKKQSLTFATASQGKRLEIEKKGRKRG